MPKFKNIKDDSENPGNQRSFNARRDAQGPSTSRRYFNRLRWDDKAKMYTVVDIPKNIVKKD